MAIALSYILYMQFRPAITTTTEGVYALRKCLVVHTIIYHSVPMGHNENARQRNDTIG